jgi:hypothetical protein
MESPAGAGAGRLSLMTPVREPHPCAPSFLPAFRAVRGASARPVVAAAAVAALVAACADSDPSALSTENAARSRAGAAGTHVQYGTPVSSATGRARTYVVLDRKAGGAPLEVGVALDERALDGLPTHGTGDGPHGNFVAYDLPMPAQNATPYRFVEIDWNPAGHGHPHGDPHFDFHFYTVTPAARNAIDPGDPQFQAKANNAPVGRLRPHAFLMYPAPPNAMAVPRMGVHWIDPRSPELQELLGNPGRVPAVHHDLHLRARGTGSSSSPSR